MKKLLKCTMLLALLISCGNSLAPPAPPRPLTKCVVPPWPPTPAIKPFACGPEFTYVCLSEEDAIALAKYEAAEQEVEAALAGCNLVTREGA